MKDVGTQIINETVKGAVHGIGMVAGATAVLGVIIYLVPGLSEAILNFLNSCFG